MPERKLWERLDELVGRVLARPEVARASADPRLDPLLEIAQDLRDLPRPAFKERLRADLERRATMTEAGVKPIREGFHTVTPYLIVTEAAELITFVKEAFGAEELLRGTGSQGGLHAEVRIGDSIVMIGGGGAWRGTPMPTAIHLYVEDADAAYRSAIRAGATSIYEPMDQSYGDREGSVKDLAGNHWYIGTHRATGRAPEGSRTVTPSLHPRGAGALIDFLKQAFGAEETSRVDGPDGAIVHANVKIGDSLLEIGEAHGPFQPMPTTFFLYVEDVEAWYRRAVDGGATSMQGPADQVYGDRVAAVTDPFGNVWYLATHVKDVSP